MKLTQWNVYRTLANKHLCIVLAFSGDEATRYASAAHGYPVTSLHSESIP